MDSSTGKLYPSPEAALAAGVKPQNLVEVSGPKAAVKKVAKAVKAMTRNQRKRARQKERGKR